MNVASGNTATATTVTDREAPAYTGRFAPSPTGALHLGSLVAALGSYLDARKAGGRWLVRMEDLDTSRVIPGCADTMLRTLEAFGLDWDGEVEYQSRRIPLYLESLQALRLAGLTFNCGCSRRELGGSETGYPGTCRTGSQKNRGSTATRFRIHDGVVSFSDRIQGPCSFEMRILSDPVIRRRDGVFAYQLAVVVDDAAQGVGDVVRGADLLQSTAWQICLQDALKLPTPRYAHLPLVVESAMEKLSKSRRSVGVDPTLAAPQLFAALTLLQQHPPTELEHASPRTLLAWATTNWSLNPVKGLKKVVAFTQMSQL